MGESPARGSSGNGKTTFDPSLGAAISEISQPNESPNLVAFLRQNLDEGLQPPAAIMHAAAEAARVLADADGAAVALRTHGMIVCRARSGDPTPDLGSPLNTESGISGECIRSASILVCHDAESDPRVDPEVCRAMGICSIAVVPLRGPSGIAGILEVFSTRVSAFGEPQIDSLRGLAEIVEMAYGREVRGLQAKPSAPVKPPRIGMDSVESAPKAPVAFDSKESSLKRKLWIMGAVAVALIIAAGIWLSGREPILETSAKEPPAETHSSASMPQPPVTVIQPKPTPVVVRAGHNAHETVAGEAVKKAAAIETIEEAESAPLKIAPGHAPAPKTTDASATGSDPEPPSVGAGSTAVTSAMESAQQISKLTTPSSAMPLLATPISQGISPGRLIHKIDPVYPKQAKMAGVDGTVDLEITIAEDGSVRDVKQVSGSPVLVSAASDAIRQWRYTPFLLNGKPTEVQKRISVVFKLPGD